MRNELTAAPGYYAREYKRKLFEEEIESGEVHIILDPYRVAKTYNIAGGAREQILKKVLRWTSKGDSEKRVLQAIICAAERNLEMIDEDGM